MATLRIFFLEIIVLFGLSFALQTPATAANDDVDCSSALLPGDGFAINRSLIGYSSYQSQLLRALGKNTSLSSREQRLAQLWYAVNRPFEINSPDQKEQLEKLSIDPLKAAVLSLRTGGNDSQSDLNFLKTMTATMFQFQAADIQAQDKLVNQVFNDTPDSMTTKWRQWVFSPEKFIQDFEFRSAAEALRPIDHHEGIRIAQEIMKETGFQELQNLDSDFAQKVLWLKQRSTDLNQFKPAIESLLKTIDADYQRLLEVSEKLRAQYPEELQPGLKSILLRRSYHRTLEREIVKLGLKTVNLDEVFESGRIDDIRFSREIFSRGLVFWDRGFSAHRSNFNPRHGQDLHILQAVIFGNQMDSEFGSGVFARFYKKIGNPAQGKAETPVPKRQKLLFYNYGFLNIFDDIYTDVPGNKYHTGIFSITNPDFSDVLMRMLPLVVD